MMYLLAGLVWLITIVLAIAGWTSLTDDRRSMNKQAARLAKTRLKMAEEKAEKEVEDESIENNLADTINDLNRKSRN